MVTLANEFAAKGYLVDLILCKKEGPYLTEVSESVNIIDLNVSRTALSIFGLASYLRSSKPDALLSTMTHVNIIAVVSKIISMVSTRVILREANTLSLNLSKHSGLSSKIMPLLVRMFYPKSDMILAVSKSVSVDLMREARLPENKITVVYNPVITNMMMEKSEENLTHQWFANKLHPVILGVGRLAYEKGFDILIKSIAKVRETTPVRLLILGEGSDREQLEEMVRQNNLQDDVSLPGYVTNPFNYMKNSDLFVLSSRWEGLPNSLIQAMALGTDVISTNCPGGSDEILESGKWGKLVDVDDADEMATAIIDTLQNKTDSNKKEMIQYCLSKFGAESVAEQYLDIILDRARVI
jgi:glycosyltransferase involved in cell wall biosynthesis